MSPLSVIQPISVAIERTKRILFEPFLLRKWLRLGFCAFLLGTLPMGGLHFGGTGTGFRFNSDSDSNSDSGGSGGPIDTSMPWLREHQGLILGGAVIAALVVLLLALLFTWLSSRGRFMLLDGVVHNRGAIKAPWHAYRREANSLFRARVVLGLIGLASLALIVAVPVLMGMDSWRRGAFSVASISVLLLAILFVFVWLLLMELISVVLADFVVPVMFLHRLPVLPATTLVFRSILQARPGSFFLYFCVRFLLNGIIATLSVLAIGLTCFAAALPYIGSVILLPLTIFQVIFPLAFLEQLGPEWRFFPPDRHALSPS